MLTGLSHPPELLGVTEILDALGIDCSVAAEDPEPYFVIPGNCGPRWLIPAQSRASAPVLSAWRPYSISGRAKWLAIRIAARAGLLRFVGSVSSVAISRTGSLRWFERCAVQSRTGEIVILVGNPSPSRKLIVFLLDDAHRIAAVLKVGLTAAGGVNVLYEAEVLSKLERYSWAPKVLSVHPDQRAAAQEYVHGDLADRRFRPDYLNLLCHLPRSGSFMNLANLAQAMAKTLSPLKAELDAIAPDVLSRSLACLDLDIAVPTMLVHGDFTPWNIRITPESSYVLVDWESADFAGLPGHDLFHFQFSNDRLFSSRKGSSPTLRASSINAEYLRRMDLDAELLPRLAIAYLLHQLEVGCKHHASENAVYALRQLAVLVDALGIAVSVRPTA
jgi:hypothetical protein